MSDGVFDVIIYVDISIVDVNDGGPSFINTPYSRTNLLESASIGASVLTVTANDPDSADSDYGKLSYSIISGNDDRKFIINPETGEITVAGVLNADTTNSYLLTVQATEQSGDNSVTATVNITVTNTNDNIPTCTSKMAFSIEIPETSAAGTSLFSLTCTDADGDTLTYTFTGAGSSNFELNGTVLQVSFVLNTHISLSIKCQIRVTSPFEDYFYVCLQVLSFH